MFSVYKISSQTRCPRIYIRKCILGVNRKQLSQSTDKTVVEYFTEVLEKVKQTNKTENAYHSVTVYCNGYGEVLASK
jgi:hypothetical protein